MALKGLDIFKLSPKKNCKECGCPTCMALISAPISILTPWQSCPRPLHLP